MPASRSPKVAQLAERGGAWGKGRPTIYLVAIAILVASAGVYLNAMYSGSNGMAGGQRSVGPPPAIGTASEAQHGAIYSYNFTVESVGADVSWNAVKLNIIGAGGRIVTSGISSYTIYDASSANVCYANAPVEIAWSPGPAGSGASPMTTSETIAVLTTVSLAGVGLQLNVSEPGISAWSTYAAIP